MNRITRTIENRRHTTPNGQWSQAIQVRSIFLEHLVAHWRHLGQCSPAYSAHQPSNSSRGLMLERHFLNGNWYASQLKEFRAPLCSPFRALIQTSFLQFFALFSKLFTMRRQNLFLQISPNRTVLSFDCKIPLRSCLRFSGKQSNSSLG